MLGRIKDIEAMKTVQGEQEQCHRGGGSGRWS